MSTTALRQDLPELPRRFKARPVDRRGFPVPWFLCDQDERAEANGGAWDFRVVSAGRASRAILSDRCWLCGEPLGTIRTFVIGPMCMLNRVTSEPPCHPGCARFAAIACPFLANPKATRREGGLPEERTVAGIMIERNPGAVVTWPAKRSASTPRRVGDGILIQLGEPVAALGAYAHGRKATPDELLASILSGLPLLRDAARKQAEMERFPARWAYGVLQRDADAAMSAIRTWLPGYEEILGPIEAAVRGLCAGAVAS